MANINETLIPIPGRLHSVANGGHVAGADEIFDDDRSLLQSTLNNAILEEKAYNAADYSGMGRVYLKKNMVNIAEEGEEENIVNLLTQADFQDGSGNDLENTIFVIQYDFTLDSDLTVPANCVLEFDGGSFSAGSGANMDTITGQNTRVVASSTKIFDLSIELSGTFIFEYGINITWFGAKSGDDISSVLSHIFIQARNLGRNFGSYRSSLNIIIPSGSYTVSALSLSNLSSFSEIHVKGSGSDNTFISYTGNGILFDNNSKFGFSTFEGITFIGNDGNQFMKTYGGVSQSLAFLGCDFQHFVTVLEECGSTMGSEYTFIRCRIKQCYDANIFIQNNPLAVDWRFFATEIETVSGVVFNLQGGGCIYYYQGSIVVGLLNDVNESDIIKVPSTANYSLFGMQNRPTLTMYGTRFELCYNTRLYVDECSRANVSVSFNDVCFARNESDRPTGLEDVVINGVGTLRFSQCVGNITVIHSNGIERSPYNIFTDMSITVTSSTGNLIVHDLKKGSSYCIDANGNYSNSWFSENTLRTVRFPTQRDGNALFYIYATESSKSANIPGGMVSSVICKNIGNSRYGSIPFKLNVYAVIAEGEGNPDSETLLCSFDCNINASSQEEKHDFPALRCKEIKAEVVLTNGASGKLLLPMVDLFITCL